MLINLLRAIERVLGTILAGLWTGVQVGNVLICLVIVILAPAVLAGFSQ
jgi:hypothetical protein